VIVMCGTGFFKNLFNDKPVEKDWKENDLI